MRVSWALAWLIGTFVGACFAEPFVYHCDRGEKGCACNDGLCLSGLECSAGHCIVPGCTPADPFCLCDDGDCNAHLVCWEGSVCVPDDGSEGSAGGSAATSDADTSTTSNASEATGSSTADSGECSCPPCHACDGTGACVVDVGASCAGEALACADFLWGYEDGTCYRLAAASVGPSCAADGSCRTATPQDCPVEKGEPAVECDDGCVDAAQLCDTYDPAETVDLETLCVTSGVGPGCGDTCSNGSGSAVYHNACQNGKCTMMALDECDPYSCADEMCNTSCASELDCAFFYDCQDGVCVLP